MQNISQKLITIILEFKEKLSLISDEEASIKLNPKKWSKKEILGHLIDSACNNQQKFVRMMNETELHFMGYRQDEWVASQNYNAAYWPELIDLWATFNLHIAHIMANVNPAVLENVIYIDDEGPSTLAYIMKDYPEHLKHHLKQIFPLEPGLENSFENVYRA
ncbi:DinB family protein [Lacihabitans sp. LS3-19]|uniref:DinB family protein n=1 Tax=Lacihabitans sp. LS3-19 TaxID=2487335 RepID=UPI0020CE0824|nr:DinB family protein [Lacihabitans sp. LS3-19]MCP9768598.1 DinB family protein [Lacihabitans sp. LS3-19]